MRGQPEDQFVEEQDQAVIAERLGVFADDGQALVQVNVGFVLPLSDPTERREDVLHQFADQLGPIFAFRWCFNGIIKTSSIPAFEFAPATTTSTGVAFVEVFEELLIAQPFPK